MTAAQLVEEIRRRHTTQPPWGCLFCKVPWPCDALRAADAIDVLVARLEGLLDTIFDAGPRGTGS